MKVVKRTIEDDINDLLISFGMVATNNCVDFRTQYFVDEIKNVKASLIGSLYRLISKSNSYGSVGSSEKLKEIKKLINKETNK